MDGYEFIPDVGDTWQPTKRDIHRQREREDISRHARQVAAAAPPLPREIIEQVAAILSCPTPKSDLVQWRLRLFCGHVVTRTVHYTHTTVHGAFSGAIACSQCGLDPATIIAAEVIGRLEDPPRRTGSPTRGVDRAKIERAIERHERELARLKAELGQSDKK